MRLVKVLSAAIVLSSMLAAPALAATCNPPGGFDAFLAAFKRDAAAKGVSPRGLSALNGITLDPSVLAADKHQGVFKQTFEEFSGRMISRDRMIKGLRLLQVHAPVLRRAEQQFGVPGPVTVAIWFTACPTCWPRLRTISSATAGSAASAGTKAIRISRRSRVGTKPWSTPKPSLRSPSDSKAAPRGRNNRATDWF